MSVNEPVMLGPNIIGNINDMYGGNSSTQGSGALLRNAIPAINSDTGTDMYYGNISLDASKSNSIYGNSSTVQPKSINLNVLIKF